MNESSTKIGSLKNIFFALKHILWVVTNNSILSSTIYGFDAKISKYSYIRLSGPLN